MKKKYERSTFLAFDELLTFLLSEVHFPVSMNYFDALFSVQPKQVPRFGDNQRILFEGIPGVCDVQMGFYPLQIIKGLFVNTWPNEFELEFEALTQNEKKKYELNAEMTYTIQVLGGCFAQFWDKATPLIKSKYGGDAKNWPMTVNFARIVRNSFAHGNKVTFENPNASTVVWKSISYSPANNGRTILFQDMGIPDFVVLIEEVCALL